MTETAPALVSFGRRVAALAEAHPDAPAITFVSADGDVTELTWRAFDARSNQVARLLADRGVDERSTVVIGLPNSVEHVILALATWKLGALALPLNAKLPPAERDAILELAEPTVVIGAWDSAGADLSAADALSADPLPDKIAHPGKAVASGGSTGRPKIIVAPNPFAFPPETLGAVTRMWAGIEGPQVQLVAGPMYHNLPFTWAHLGLFLDHRLVVMERFDAATAVQLIEDHGVTFAPLVPTMMQRILQVPGIEKRDLSTLQCVFHTAAPCPAWVKRGWIDLIGGEHVHEVFASTEGAGSCAIRGDEWLAHPGSVGRPTPDTEVVILDGGREVATGEVGEIFMRHKQSQAPTYEYVGSPPATTAPGGFVSVGDLGWVDEDGYVFVADRRADLIITGGANVYPAEVELALAEHPGVVDSAVVGLPSEEWGRQVHAIVQPVDMATADEKELDRFLRERLAVYKVPKTYEFVAELPRDEAGKIRRSALATERIKVELGSEAWVDVARVYLQEHASEIPEGVRFSLCEVFTDPPDGSPARAWWFAIDGPSVEVGIGDRRDVEQRVEVDYATTLPTAHMVYDLADPKTREVLRKQAEWRKEQGRPDLPPALGPVLMGLHNHLAVRTT